MNEIIKITKSEIDGNEVNSVNAKEIYDFLEVKTAYTTWIQRTVDKYGFRGEEDFKSLSYKKPSGQTEKLFIVTIDMAKELCMITDTAKGKEVRRYFIDIEKHKNIPKTQLELAKEQVALLERLEEVEKEKQYAIETKAWISDKKTATAMCTASQKTKENKKLLIQLDESMEFATTKRVELITGSKFGWKKLKDVSKSNGYPIKKVFDSNYGEVNTYYHMAWQDAYKINIGEI